MVVAHHDPGGEARARPDGGGMQGPAPRHHAVYDFLKQAADDHVFAFAVIAGHEGAHQSPGGAAPQETALLHQQHPHALPGRGDGGAHAGGSAADDDHIGAQRIPFRRQIKLRHKNPSKSRISASKRCLYTPYTVER